jgi:hypothetical protein
MPDLKLTGSCLCGSVHYEISGELKRFYHCHCQRCRKATGTGHASNIMLKPDSIRWSRGENLLNSFRPPDAERFTSTFCSQCGSPMPRVLPELGIVVVPAGSLDNALDVKPQARIFWDSRAEWSCEAGDLPVYAEYPVQD